MEISLLIYILKFAIGRDITFVLNDDEEDVGGLRGNNNLFVLLLEI